MIKINQIKVSASIDLDEHINVISRKVAKKLNIKSSDIGDIYIIKRSIDARKDEINYVYSVVCDIPSNIKISSKDKDISTYDEDNYVFPAPQYSGNNRPIIVGMGPAGLFCAYMLVKNGFKPILFERGKCVDDRTNDVEKFWETGILDVSSNVQFGEGGAGTFSDGKLNTLVKDKFGRNKEVLKVFVQFGAPKEILYDNKPHIGTDILKNVVKNMSKYISDNGGDIHYHSCVDKFEFSNDQITAIYANGVKYETNTVVLAIGHSARDTFEILNSINVPMEAKAFAVGFRVMHPQHIIDVNQYGNVYKNLPVASYKVTSNFERGVYSFCMCPGGYVVNASSEDKRLAVNGMSYHARDSKVANSAIIVQVTPKDYGSDDVLAGMYWQRKLEEKAYVLGNGKIPIQRYKDYKTNAIGDSNSTAELEFEPECKGKWIYTDLSTIFPDEINHSFIKGMEYFGKKIKYFNDGNTILAGVESRTSSPVRINRDEDGQSRIKGIYPCGEGAGYAGGITSAAMDGIFIAEKIALNNI